MHWSAPSKESSGTLSAWLAKHVLLRLYLLLVVWISPPACIHFHRFVQSCVSICCMLAFNTSLCGIENQSKSKKQVHMQAKSLSNQKIPPSFLSLIHQPSRYAGTLSCVAIRRTVRGTWCTGCTAPSVLVGASRTWHAVHVFMTLLQTLWNGNERGNVMGQSRYLKLN